MAVREGRRVLPWLLVLTAALLAATVLIVPQAFTDADPYALNLSQQLRSSGAGHLLGTDQFGRDELSRLVYGARATLGAAGVVMLAAVVVSIGVAAGTVMLPSRPRQCCVVALDLCLALPTQVVAVAVIGVLGPSLENAIIAVLATGWAAPARLLRGLLASQVHAPHVEAARAQGASLGRILRRHLLPAAAGRAAIIFSQQFGQYILTLSALSFLGFGAQPPAAEWGAMLNEAHGFFLTTPALMVWPGGAIMLVVAGCGWLAESLDGLLRPA